MFKGRIDPIQSLAFLQSHEVHEQHVRDLCGAKVSSLAVGTYLGAMDMATDRRVAQGAGLALARGVNIFDSAINYRGQRGERSLGEAFRQVFLQGKVQREQIFVSSKGGFVPFNEQPVDDLKEFFLKEYVGVGGVSATDLVAECHCMHPSFLENQLERSRKNLGLETIDLYYVHNPETQLEEYPARIFYERLFETFRFLEKARADGRIGAYGLATWDGFREQPTASGHLDLAQVLKVAESAAPKGADHGLKAIQLPFNLAMIEAGFSRTQGVLPPIAAAKKLGLDVAVSAPLYQSRLCGDLPEFITKHFMDREGLTDAQRALLFATSMPGVSSVMTGMKDVTHVTENTAVLKMPPFTVGRFDALVRSLVAKK